MVPTSLVLLPALPKVIGEMEVGHLSREGGWGPWRKKQKEKEASPHWCANYTIFCEAHVQAEGCATNCEINKLGVALSEQLSSSS